MLNPFTRIFNKDRLNITKSQDAIRETIHNPTKLQMIDAAISRIDAETARTDSQITDNRAHMAALDGHPGNQPGADIESKGNISIATTFGVAGLGTQYLVNQAPFGAYGPLVVGASALFVDLGLGALGYAVLQSLNNHVRPEQTLRVGKRISLAATTVVFGAGGLAMYARFATESTGDMYWGAASVAMWVLAELLPFAGGMWLSLARLRGYPHAVRAEIGALEERRVSLGQFREWLLAERKDLTKVDSTSSEPAKSDSVDDEGDDNTAGSSRIPVKVAGLLFALSTASGVVSAQTCGIASDRGHVGVPTARKEAIDISIARLDEFVSTRGCRIIVASAFTDAGAFTQRVSFEVPQRGARRDCSSRQPIHVDRKHAALAPIGGYREHLQKVAQDQCLTHEARLDSLFKSAWNRLTRELRAVIGQEQILTPTRIDITGQIKSFADAGIRDLLVITTGIDFFYGIPEKLPPVTRVVFMLYEPKEGFGGRGASDAASERWRRAGASALAYPLFTPGIWTRALSIAPS